MGPLVISGKAAPRGRAPAPNAEFSLLTNAERDQFDTISAALLADPLLAAAARRAFLQRFWRWLAPLVVARRAARRRARILAQGA